MIRCGRHANDTEPMHDAPMSTPTLTADPPLRTSAAADVPRWMGAAAGAASAALALGVGELIAGSAPGCVVPRRRRRPGRHRPPAARGEGLRRRPVRDERQARPRDRRRAGLAGVRGAARHRGHAPVRYSRPPGSWPSGSSGSRRPSAIRSPSRRWSRSRRRSRSGLGIQALSWLLARAAAAVGHRWRRQLGPSPTRPADPFLLRTGAVGVGALVAGVGGRALLERTRTAPAGIDVQIPPAIGGRATAGRRGGPRAVHARPDADRHPQRSLLPDRYGPAHADRGRGASGRSASTAWSIARPR